MSWSWFHGFCVLVLCVHSSFAIISHLVAFTSIVFLLSCGCLCLSVSRVSFSRCHGVAGGRIKRGAGGPDPPLKNKKNIGFRNISGPDPLKNHKATEPAFNVWPSSTRQRNAKCVSLAGR